MPYIETFGGYIADTAILDFIRCDGRAFHFDKTSTTSITHGRDSLTITGGWGGYPLAMIDTTQTLDVTFASSEFTLDLFSMANGAAIETADTNTREADYYPVDTGLTIRIPYQIDITNYNIDMDNFTRVTAAPAVSGEVQAVYTAPTATEPGYTTLTLFAGDAAVGDDILVSYYRRIVEGHSIEVLTNSASAMGELHIHWPVYAGSGDCTDSAVVGYVHFRIYRVRVTTPPGMDTSFKTASTNSLTFSAVDPKRSDRQLFKVTFEELENGAPVQPDDTSPAYSFEY